MNALTLTLLTLLACGEKEEDTGFLDNDTDTEDTNSEDTDTSSEDTDTNTEDTEDTNTEMGLEIVGTYTDNWLGTQIVSDDSWDSGTGYTFSISQYDNNAAFLLAQNDETNDPQYGNPGKWSKFQWTTNENGGLYYCQSIFDAASEEDAMGANADASDLSMGCGGFAWTELREQLDLTGDFVDGWGLPHNINAFVWLMDTSVFNITGYSNEEDWAIAQNDANNEYNPDLWSKFEWFVDGDGAWHYCQSAYDAASKADAMMASADNSDLETGCGGFAWSPLSPAEQ